MTADPYVSDEFLEMLRTCAIAILLLLLTPLSSFAQTATITGVVTDSTTGDPLPGVNVIVQGTTLGAATDLQGNYTIRAVPVGEKTVAATFIGFRTQTKQIEVEEGTNVLNFSIVPEAVGLDDVVVTALGIERQERSIGYSVQEVEGADLARVPETNFVSSIEGQVAGANFFTSNAMGGSTRIILRGANSVAGNNQPLIVVDGIPINNQNFQGVGQESGSGGYDYGNAASIINPQDVRSVSVLKGPSAAALYGSRGANGVIEITTKRGEGLVRGIGVTINTNMMARQVYGLPDYQNLYGGGANLPFSTTDGDFVLEEGEQRIADYSTDQSWGPRMDGREVRQWYSWDDVNGLLGEATPWVARPNNVQNFFETGLTNQTTVSFSQAGDDFNYRVSLANLSVSDTYPNSSLGRRSVGINGQVDLTDDFRVVAIANYIDQSGEGRPGTGYDNENVFLQFNHFGQRQVALGEDSFMRDFMRPNGDQRAWNWFGVEGAQQGVTLYTDNPYWVRFQNFQTDDTDRLFGKVLLQYDITDNLLLEGEAGTDYYTERREERVATNSTGQAEYSEEIFEVQEMHGQGRLSYNQDLTTDLGFNAFAATEYRYSQYQNNLGITSGGLSAPNVFSLENSVSRPTINDYFQESGIVSLYGAARFDFQNTFFLEGTLRNDWSSTLPDENNSYIYPSVSASYVYSEHLGADFLDYGKLRLSWAQVGSGTDPYRLGLTFPLGQPFEGSPIQSLPYVRPNPDLKPERTTGWEIGTQVDLFDYRLGLDATYYSESTHDQILAVDVSRASGFGQMLVNAGEITNSGIELALRMTPVLLEDFQWDLNVNWATNESEVIELAEDLDSYLIGPTPFGPDIVARPGEPYGAIYGSDFVYDEEGNKVLNANGSYQSSAPTVIGSYQPDWTGGLSTTLSFKGVSASVLLTGQKGGDIYSLSNLFGLYSGIYEETAADNVREVGLIPEGVYDPNPGDDVTEYVPFDRVISANSYFVSLFSGPDAAQVYDASYIKLREVAIGYTLPSRLFGNLGVRRMTISFIGRNLATLLKYTPNFDPSTALSASNVQGLEVGQIPPSRSYGINLLVEL